MSKVKQYFMRNMKRKTNINSIEEKTDDDEMENHTQIISGRKTTKLISNVLDLLP